MLFCCCCLTVLSAHVYILSGHSKDVASVAFSPDGTRIVSGSYDRSIKIWDSISGAEIISSSGNILLQFLFLSWIPRKRSGSAFYYEIAFYVYDYMIIFSSSLMLFCCICLTVLPAHFYILSGHSSAVAFSPDGTRIVSGSGDHSIKIWDSISGAEIISLSGNILLLYLFLSWIPRKRSGSVSSMRLPFMYMII